MGRHHIASIVGRSTQWYVNICMTACQRIEGVGTSSEREEQYLLRIRTTIFSTCGNVVSDFLFLQKESCNKKNWFLHRLLSDACWLSDTRERMKFQILHCVSRWCTIIDLRGGTSSEREGQYLLRIRTMIFSTCGNVVSDYFFAKGIFQQKTGFLDRLISDACWLSDTRERMKFQSLHC